MIGDPEVTILAEAPLIKNFAFWAKKPEESRRLKNERVKKRFISKINYKPTTNLKK
jgi:hypothetical protein